MKIVKFQSNLVPLILSSEKNSTWRLFDDKDLTIGDKIELREFGNEEAFARAEITKIIEKPFGEMTNEDKIGHESYTTDEQMYKTYSGYYNTPVDSTTVVKIIWFDLIT